MGIGTSCSYIPWAQGQRNWFATAAGTGSGLTWATACTFNPAPVTISPLYVPSNSYIGAKLASSSGGDTATITLNYQAL